MDQFVEILTKPDNIPIVGMLVAIAVCLWVALRQALRNDRFAREGRKDRIYEDMVR